MSKGISFELQSTNHLINHPMDFGRVDNIDSVDYTLPPDDAVTKETLKNLKSNKKHPLNCMQVAPSRGVRIGSGKCTPRVPRAKTSYRTM